MTAGALGCQNICTALHLLCWCDDEPPAPHTPCRRLLHFKIKLLSMKSNVTVSFVFLQNERAESVAAKISLANDPEAEAHNLLRRSFVYTKIF
jgi:hypothetical protein